MKHSYVICRACPRHCSASNFMPCFMYCRTQSFPHRRECSSTFRVMMPKRTVGSSFVVWFASSTSRFTAETRSFVDEMRGSRMSSSMRVINIQRSIVAPCSVVCFGRNRNTRRRCGGWNLQKSVKTILLGTKSATASGLLRKNIARVL